MPFCFHITMTRFVLLRLMTICAILPIRSVQVAALSVGRPSRQLLSTTTTTTTTTTTITTATGSDQSSDENHSVLSSCILDDDNISKDPPLAVICRRSLLRNSFLATMAGAVMGSASLSAFAETATATIAEPTVLEKDLYRIIRVREATQQERRLILTGKFKDVQRANVKLAVKFMVQNYRLADAIVSAAAYLKGNALQMKAIDVGQTAVQNLQTILEYFDSADVQNIKVRYGHISKEKGGCNCVHRIPTF